MFLDVPLGHTTGAPGEVDSQRQILQGGLEAGAAMTEPGTIAELPFRWRDDEWKADPLSWSRRRQDSGQTSKPAGDTRTARSDEPRYQSDEDRAAAAARSHDDQCLVCLGIG